MSIPTTNFQFYNSNTGLIQDLSGIFKPYISGAQSFATGYIVNSYGDLNTFFEPLGTNEQTSFTNYIVNNYQGIIGNNLDLSEIFAPVNQYNGIWPYINLNNKNTRQSIYNGPPALPNPPLIKWTYSNGSASFNENQLVIGPTGIIYIAEDYGNIYALNDDGDNNVSLLFSFNTGYGQLKPPTIGLNNIMYFVGPNIVKAVQNINTSNPSVLWTLNITSPPLTNPMTPIIGANGIMYVSTNDGYIFAINNINSQGSVKWFLNVSNPDYLLGIVIGNDRTIYTSSYEYVYAITDNGNDASLKWKLLVGTGFFLSPLSIGSNGIIYTYYNNTTTNNMIMNAVSDNGNSGELKWSLTVGNILLYECISISNNNTIYVISSTTINSITDNGTYGTNNWTCITNSRLRSVVIGQDGAIYSSGDYGEIVRITDNGNTYNIDWSYRPVAGGFSSPLAIGGNGTIYYGGDHNYILAIH